MVRFVLVWLTVFLCRPKWDTIARVAAQARPTPNDFQLVRWIKSAQFLQMELFTMASGHDLAFPPPQTAGAARRWRQRRETARALGRLWLRLPTMARVNETIDNATAEAARDLVDLDGYRAAVESAFERIERNLRADARLTEERERATAKVGDGWAAEKAEVYFWNSTDDRATLTPQMLTRWLRNPEIRRYAINGDFLYYCARPSGPVADVEERERHVLAGSVLELGEDAEVAETAQKLYDDALEETLNRTMSVGPEVDCRAPKSILFDMVAKNFGNSSLKTRLESIKTRMRATIPKV